jgi:hypothetical protein
MVEWTDAEFDFNRNEFNPLGDLYSLLQIGNSATALVVAQGSFFCFLENRDAPAIEQLMKHTLKRDIEADNVTVTEIRLTESGGIQASFHATFTLDLSEHWQSDTALSTWLSEHMEGIDCFVAYIHLEGAASTILCESEFEQVVSISAVAPAKMAN